VTLAPPPTPPQVAEVVLFMSSFVGVISAAPNAVVRFLSPAFTDLTICRSARRRRLIQVSCHLCRLLSQPVRNLLNGLLFLLLLLSQSQ